jgi:hypothetical protein
MKKILPIFFSSLLIIEFITLPQFAQIQYPQKAFAEQTDAPGALPSCAENEVQTDFGCFPNNPIGFVQKFYGFGLAFVGMCALLTLIIGGYDVMTSQGDPRRLSIGKSYIYYSIAGLLLAIFGYVVIRVIVADVLKVPGFK